MERAGDTDEVVEGGGLLGGVNAWHLRVLCENPWNGGGGYTPEQVGRMSLDQVWFRLTALDVYKTVGGGRTEKIDTAAVPAYARPDGEGLIAGRAADGSPIRGVIRGRSVARELREREQAEMERSKRRRRRKGKRK